MRESILITGASSDLGMALIRRLDKKGLTILGHTYSGRAKLESLSREVEAEIKIIEADFSEPKGILEFVEKLNTCGETPAKVIHLPSPPPQLSSFKKTSPEDFQKHWHVQVLSITLILQKLLPKMAKIENAKVVFMLSSYTRGLPPKGLAAYVSAKYALLGLMKSLSSEMISKGVRINAVSPSMMQTSFIEGLPDFVSEKTATEHPLKRLARVEDVVPTIEFLLSENSDYISGENICISGGGAS